MTKLRLVFLTLIILSILFASAQSFAEYDRSGDKVDDARKERIDPEDAYREEFLQWYKEFYPEIANEIEALKKKDPKLYEERYKLKEKKFGGIMETQKKNPDFGKALMDDLKIAAFQNKTLGKLRTEKNKIKRQQYIDQLGNIVSRRFDLAVKIKQFKYEELSQKIKRLEKILARRQKEVQELTKRKVQEVEKRVKHLLEEDEKINSK